MGNRSNNPPGELTVIYGVRVLSSALWLYICKTKVEQHSTLPYFYITATYGLIRDKRGHTRSHTAPGHIIYSRPILAFTMLLVSGMI